MYAILESASKDIKHFEVEQSMQQQRMDASMRRKWFKHIDLIIAFAFRIEENLNAFFLGNHRGDLGNHHLRHLQRLLYQAHPRQ